MSLDREKAAMILNSLITICKDSEEGYDRAADDVEDGTHKDLFRQYAAQRIQFISQLQAQIKLLGEQVGENDGTFAGELHQAWMGLKAVLTSGNLGALLTEIERGEDAAVAAYQKALKEDLPEHAREVVQQQSDEIKTAHDRIRAMRDVAR